MGRHPPAPPAWVCAPDHLSRREKRPRREARCLRGRGCFPEYKSALLSPLLKISMVLHAYRDTSTFLVVAKALYLVTHKLFLPVPCTFPGPPPLWREGHTAAIREDGRWALGGADPCRSLRGLPRKLSEAGSTPGRGLCPVVQPSHKENVSCSSNALGDLPFCFSRFPGIVPPENPHW